MNNLLNLLVRQVMLALVFLLTTVAALQHTTFGAAPKPNCPNWERLVVISGKIIAVDGTRLPEPISLIGGFRPLGNKALIDSSFSDNRMSFIRLTLFWSPSNEQIIKKEVMNGTSVVSEAQKLPIGWTTDEVEQQDFWLGDRLFTTKNYYVQEKWICEDHTLIDKNLLSYFANGPSALKQSRILSLEVTFYSRGLHSE